jgi:hypothetical protein
MFYILSDCKVINIKFLYIKKTNLRYGKKSCKNGLHIA